VNIHLLGAKLKICLKDILIIITVRNTVSTDNNKGLFDKIKKTVDSNQIKSVMGQKSAISQEQQAQLRELFKTENEEYKKALKEKYQSIAKSVVLKREQELLEKFKQELFRIKAQEGNNADVSQRQQKILAATWHSQVQALQQELEQQKALVQTSINQGMEAGREIGLRQAEQKYARILSDQSSEFNSEYQRVLDKEQALKHQFHVEFKKQEELLNIQNTAKLSAELAKEQQRHTLELEHIKSNLSAKIVDLERQLAIMQPDVEANKQRMKEEIEAELQASYAIKFEDYKHEIARLKSDEVQSMLIGEKQRLAVALEQENVVVLKYKERELRDQFDAELAQLKNNIKLENEQFQVKFKQQSEKEFKDMLEQQEQRLIAEAQLKIEHEKLRINAELTSKIQDAVTQERLRLNSQHTNENKILLQQQHDALVARHEADLATKLAELSSKLDRAHKEEIEAIEYEHKQAIAKAVSMREKEIKYEYQLDNIDQHKENLEAQKRVELANFEKQLRKEFQELLEQQRRLAKEKFVNQRAQEIQQALAKYRGQIENDVKDQYADKWQQHAAMLKAELEQKMQQEISEMQKDLGRQKLVAMKEQEQKLEQKMQQKMNEALEEERKKLGLKFAQDKSALIKDLGAKFAYEKQIAIENYENDLRDTLYKEMVKQKEHIQSKFIKGQETALLEQKRRLEAEHKLELERAKQGYFDKKGAEDFSQAVINTRLRHNPVAVELGVEQLADRILAKFQTGKDKH